MRNKSKMERGRMREVDGSAAYHSREKKCSSRGYVRECRDAARSDGEVVYGEEKETHSASSCGPEH